MGRKRTHDVRIRMSDDEYRLLQKRIVASGISIQNYGIAMLLQQPIVTRMEQDILLSISSELHDAVRAHRGISNNVNQIARKANSEGYVTDDLLLVQDEYKKDHETLERIWTVVRRMIADGNNKNDRP